MRRKLFVAGVLSTLLLTSTTVAAQECQEPSRTDSIVDRRVATNPAGILVLGLGTGGSVAIRGWDQNAVRARAILGGRDWRRSRVGLGAKAGNVRLHTQPCGSPRTTSTSHRFEVWVPRECSVEVASIGGSIEITDVRGVFRGHTDEGNIELTRVRGEAELTTRGGHVTIEDSNLEGSVTTRGGAITRTRVRGGVRTGGPEAVLASAPSRMEVTSRGGPISLGVAEDGAVLKTGGGPIEVDYAAGSLDAETGAGNITIKSANGSVRAVTGYGDVHIRVATLSDTQAVNVHSGWGRVIVELSGNFSGTVELEAGYTEMFGRPVVIMSDWTLTHSTAPAVMKKGDIPQRLVRASGTIGNGKARVRVRTTNGDIELRK